MTTALMALALGGPVQAQDAADTNTVAALEEVIVTATERVENIQDIPVSITVLSGEDIDLLADLERVEARLSAQPSAPLLSGSEVIEATGCGAGPQVGALLRALAEARDDGAVVTRAEALDFVRRRWRRGVNDRGATP